MGINPVSVNVLTGAVSYGGEITGSNITDGTVTVADISATGTPSSSTYLRGDGTWSTASGGSADALGLTPTAVKTSNYTAAVGDFVPVNTTSGTITVTLPTAPTDGSVIAVKHVIQASTNAVTIAAGGSDVFDVASGATTASLSLLMQSVVLQYKATGAIWYQVADNLPLSLLAKLASPTFTGTPAAPTAAVDTNTTQVATTAFVIAQASSTTPIIDGTATVGSETKFARGNHIHPTDTSRAAVANTIAPLDNIGGAFYRSNIPRAVATNAALALTSQVMHSVAVYLTAGEVVTSITFLTGTTAAGTPTNWWFALYDTQSTPALIAQTADQTSTAWAANTPKTLALSSPYTVTTTGIHYAAVMVKASSTPTLRGNSHGSTAALDPVVSGQKVLAQTSGSSLTTTAPSTIASPTTSQSEVMVFLT